MYLKLIKILIILAIENEIYINGDWYLNYEGYHYAIFRSIDNGENITIQYEYINPSPSGVMSVERPLGDAQPGVLYNYHFYKDLWISYDYGVNWVIQDDTGWFNKYASGRIPGEVFKLSQPYEGIQKLFYSTDYGANYILKNDSCWGSKIDVGLNEGEVFILKSPTIPVLNLELMRSFDYGVSIDTIHIDTTISGLYLAGHFPYIIRGAYPGELYLVTWHLPSNYKIYFSTDYGNNFTLRYISDYIDFFYYSVHFTAGRTPGSFYVIRAMPDTTNYYSWMLYIDYSVDTAKTFITYEHSLDSTIVGINEKHFQTDLKTKCYPNPFNSKTNIVFELNKNTNTQINIYNLNGQLVRQLLNNNLPAGQHNISWDGTNEIGHQLKSGIYFYRLKTDDGVFRKKMVLVR
jgi:hypothetical protein